MLSRYRTLTDFALALVYLRKFYSQNLSLLDILFRSNCTAGNPTNTIQGTNITVRINVRKYNGITDK